MRILFDNATPRPIAQVLLLHEVTLARSIRWHELANGELIQMAEDAGFDVLLTPDKNIRYLQNLEGRRIALVVLGNQQWPMVKLNLDKIAAAINAATPGSTPKSKFPSARSPKFTNPRIIPSQNCYPTN